MPGQLMGKVNILGEAKITMLLLVGGVYPEIERSCMISKRKYSGFSSGNDVRFSWLCLSHEKHNDETDLRWSVLGNHYREAESAVMVAVVLTYVEKSLWCFSFLGHIIKNTLKVSVGGCYPLSNEHRATCLIQKY